MTNFSTLNGGPYPSHSAGPIYTVSDSLTWIKGSHTLKFGGRWERAGENDNDEINVQGVPGGTNNQNGQFTFTDTRSATARTRAPRHRQRRPGPVRRLRGDSASAPTRFSAARMYEGFAQDSWKANQKLHHRLRLPLHGDRAATAPCGAT